MNVRLSMRLTRILTLAIPALLLAGCFGNGDGPTRIAGNPPPPVDCNALYNFEEGCGPFSFNNFEGGTSVIIDNPDKSGLNTTDRVVQMTKGDARTFGGATFGGTAIAVFDPIDFSAGEAFTMLVWSSRNVPVLFKWQESEFEFQERSVDHTGGGEWQELCFDFGGTTAGLNPGELVVIFDVTVFGEVETNPSAWTFYYDEVRQVASCGGGGGPGPSGPPTTGAPTPTQDAGSVISLYSDAYTDVATTWPTTWSDPNNTTSDITVAGGLVKEHLAINFVGVEFTVDATSMTHVHFDVWTPDATSLLFRLVDFGGDGFGGANADTQADVTLDATSTPALAQGSWVSVDIPLQTFLDNGLASVADLNQIVLDPPDGTTVYVDNLYFYDDNAGGGGTGEIAINGGFETGDLSDWALFPVSVDPGEQTVVTTNPKTGTYAGRINNTTPGSASIIKQANRTPVAIGQTASITFSARGNFGVGGVAFAEFFTEISGGGASSSQILGGGPLALNADPNVWTDFSFSVPISADVSGGVTLQLTGTTGGDPSSFADVYYDDISIVISDGSGP